MWQTSNAFHGQKGLVKPMQGTRFTGCSINGSGSDSGSSTKTRSREGGGTALSKGPWMAEEDEILLEYVSKHGPRDWSSIRSKGLLSRTGKSCRLRWVNKLKPDLKTGCKFSPEEERIVINLQAQFGNKWARIATYLPGRTDNDVKNFWSTRQKRLARILRTPLPSKSNKYHGKLSLFSHEAASSSEANLNCDPSLDLILSEEDYSCKGQCSKTSSYMAQVPDLVSCPCVLNLDTLPPALHEPAMDRELPCLMDHHPMSLQLPFDHLPQPLLGLPSEPEDSHLLPGHGGISFPVRLACQEPSPCIQLLPEELPLFFGFETGLHGVKREDEHPRTADSFFDEFPSDMFDFLEPQQPPPTSSKSC